MPTPMAHAAFAVAAGTAFPKDLVPRRMWIAGALCAAAPDLDKIGLMLGVPYGSMFGHRGFTHSIFFAAVAALIVTAIVTGRGHEDVSPLTLGAYLFLATASHGVLDAMTNGGHGVALFAPFSNARLFLPWRPIRVAPLSVAAMLTRRGLEVVLSEAFWVGLPSLALAGVATLAHRAAGRRRAGGSG